MAEAIFAGGCFWCTEAVFRSIAGVSAVESGYIGGTVPHPTYKAVCTGETGHAEAIKLTFDEAEKGAVCAIAWCLCVPPSTWSASGSATARRSPGSTTFR